jgi:polyketide synthase PksN
VIQDNFIVKKTARELAAVLAPKVIGAVNLDHATRAIDLDYLILFSSLAGVTGNVGQGDYALANAFMDRFAQYRNELLKQGRRRGQCLSVNWPLWAQGGMRIDEATLESFRRQGLHPLSNVEGIRALAVALSSGRPQVAVASGDPLRILERLFQSPPAAAERVQTTAQIDTAALLESVESMLVEVISQQLKVRAQEIDVEAELGEFGFDSISLTTFSNTLNQVYGLQLSPTIFFEYPTVRGFAGYLATEHAASLAQKLSVQMPPGAAPTELSSCAGNGVPQEAHVPGMVEAALSRSSRVSVRDRHRLTRQAPGESTRVPQPAPGPEPVAIIGMSGRFPGATDVDAFWENLKDGKDCITEIPASRWDWRTIYGDPATQANRTNIKWGGFMEGIDEFDPQFFSISPREAQLMDPQQRLLMMYVWKAIEEAGYSAQELAGSRTGIFVGTDNSGYGELISRANMPIEGYSSTGAVSSVGPNRMSYFLDLHGPSEPIETACSSSLVAIHRAVRAMQSGDCDMAVAGGINTIITPWAHISFSKAGMLSPDGRCRTFSQDANGYVRGEGMAMLLLKKLSAAERDGDHIHALIRGSAENHGGRANSLTAPNPKAQAELIKAAYAEAGIDPRTVTYIETHGTGTPLGDPVEINGLKSAFADLCATPSEGEAPVGIKGAYCGLGSVKTNIGHLELAAGVAGVVKVLLQFKHRTLVKSLHCEQINPYIKLQDSPFYIVRQTQEWSALRDGSGRELPRRAGVSSFGFGGVNAHVILEEYRPPHVQPPLLERLPLEPALIVLSARNSARLKEQVGLLLAHLTTHSYGDQQLVDIAYTLQVGRAAMEQRLALVVDSIDALREKLAAYLAGQAPSAQLEGCFQGEVGTNRDALLSIFNTDDALQQAVATWVKQGKYARLLLLWVQGLSFDWKGLYTQGQQRTRVPRRLSLPTYPFARERHWVEPPVDKSPEREVPDHSIPGSFDVGHFATLLEELAERRISVDTALERVVA